MSDKREFPILNGKLLSDLDANGHKIIGADIEVAPEMIREAVAPELEAKANATDLEAEVARATDAETALGKEIAKKVDTEEGKGLSTNDYTTDEKEKLGGIEEGAQKNPDLSGYAKKKDIPYALIEVPLEDIINLTGKAVNRVVVDDSLSSITFIFPKKVDGEARDFFIRLEITGDTIPTISFVEPNGDAVSFDVDDDSWAEIEQGVNILMFTDTGE